VTKVVAKASSTAVIDAAGELKFWFNRLDAAPEGAMTLQGYSNGKLSLSSRFFCAINTAQALSCFRVNQSTATLKKLHVPRFSAEGVIDVSAGPDQICAVTVKSAISCWTYASRGSQLLHLSVPNRMRKAGSARSVQTGDNKNCAIDADHNLTCWGVVEGRKYTEQFEDKERAVRQVSIGQDFFCFIKSVINPDIIDNAGQLGCFNTALNKNLGVPKDFKKDVKQVSVEGGQVCAIKR